MKNAIFSTILFFLASLTLFAQQKTAVICGKLIDGNGTQPVSNAVILIEGERIAAIGTRALLTADYEVIDLSAFTVLPGLIDVHVHPLISEEDYQVSHLKNSSAGKALRGLKNVQRWLQEGWTTIRVAGDADVFYAHFAIRDAINSGMFTGPRIFGAGHYLSITGGGGDINDMAPEQKIIADGLIVDGAEEMRKAVRTEIKNGSDWIKLLVTGAFMSAGDNPQNAHFSNEEIRVAVEEATKRGVPLMAHAHGTGGINQAIKLGARSIEHGSFLTEESIALFLEYDAYLVPTLSVGTYFETELKKSQALSKAIELGKKYRTGVRAMLSKAIARGVKIGVGSDNVGFPPNFAAKEFGLLVELGMTPMQAIQAGTRVNAELLMQAKDIGTIEAGKFADIIAVQGDPLEDITELERVRFVMKSGEVIRE